MKSTKVILSIVSVFVFFAQEIDSQERFPTLARFSDIHMEKAFPPTASKSKGGSITYTLIEPARVRVRVVAKGTRELYLRHIVDWQFRDKGTHTETWDCKDNSGHPIARQNAVIRVMGEPMSTYKPGSVPLENLSPEEIIHGHKFGHIHNRHHKYACRESLLEILSPKEGERLGGKVIIRSRVDKERRGYGDTYGYGVRYYINHVLVHEEFYKPESDGKFTYELDTTAHLDGDHLLHVGMCDHNDHATSASVRIILDNSGLRPR